MAIQIGGTTVIDNSRNLTNIASIFSCTGIASQAEAEAGTSSTKLMTPERVAQAISALGGNVINRIQRGVTSFTSSATSVPITSVNTNKSFISSSFRGDMTGGRAVAVNPTTTFSYAAGANGSGSASLASATSVTVQGGQSFNIPITLPSPFGVSYSPIPLSNTGTVTWEVIEFK